MQQIIETYTLQKLIITPEQQSDFTATKIFFLIYGISVSVLLLKLFIQTISILKIKRMGTKELVQGVEVITIHD